MLDRQWAGGIGTGVFVGAGVGVGGLDVTVDSFRVGVAVGEKEVRDAVTVGSI